MSLINQMLQDLDSRRAASGPGSRLPNEVRPLPPARRSVGPLIAGAGFALAGALAWQFAGWRPSDPVAAVAPSLPVSPVVPPPLAVAPLPPSLPEPAASVEDEEASLRLMTSLRLLPEREPAQMPRSMGPAVPKVAAPLAPAVPMEMAKNVTPPVLKAAGPVAIEKSAASGSPHERAEGEYRKAMSILNMGRAAEAVENLRLALKQESAHIASRQLLFKLLVESKRLEEAADLLHEGLQSQPAQISWAMSLGRLQVDRGDLNAAWQTLQRSLPFAANSADYQGFAAHVLQRLGRSKDAAERYQAATRLAPAEGRWWLGLGLALEAEGHALDARDALLRARASGTLSAELIALVDQKLR